MRPLILSIFVGLLMALNVDAAGEKAVLTADEGGADYVVQGEYEGVDGDRDKVGVQVIALGGGTFEAVLYDGGLPGAGWNLEQPTRIAGTTLEETTAFSSDDWSGVVKDGKLELSGPDNQTVTAEKTERRSPTLGAKPPEGATVLFDGSNLEAWDNGRFVEVAGKNYLGVGVRTKDTFQDFRLHLEFRTPFMPASRGQSRGNSGMYLLDQYECQVLDSFGLEGKDNECGGIYKVSKPDVNMCFPPLSWQTYDVEFTAAKFDEDGKKTADAITTIRHNGVVIHGDRQLPAATPGGGRRDETRGALYLQNHGDPVVFRNIWIVTK